MSTCNHCGRWTDNTKMGEDCRYCKEVYAQGVADGIRKSETELTKLKQQERDRHASRTIICNAPWVNDPTKTCGHHNEDLCIHVAFSYEQREHAERYRDEALAEVKVLRNIVDGVLSDPVTRPEVRRLIERKLANFNSPMHYRTLDGTSCGLVRVVGVVRYTGVRDDVTCWECRKVLGLDEVQTPAPKTLQEVRTERCLRFNDTTGTLRGGNSHPDRCVCQEKEGGTFSDTPHKHYKDAPHSCARCMECQAYVPHDESESLLAEVRRLKTAAADVNRAAAQVARLKAAGQFMFDYARDFDECAVCDHPIAECDAGDCPGSELRRALERITAMPETAKIDPRPMCIGCSRRFVPREGQDATCQQCDECRQRNLAKAVELVNAIAGNCDGGCGVPCPSCDAREALFHLGLAR